MSLSNKNHGLFEQKLSTSRSVSPFLLKSFHQSCARSKELARFATYYEKLLKPEKETNTKIQRALQRLNRIEVTTAYPLLLNFYEDYAHCRISAEEFVVLLEVIENFIIRRFVSNIASNQLNKVFPTLYRQIKDKYAENSIEGLKSVLQTRYYSKDVEFRQRLLDTRLYGNGDGAIKTKLILESIEEFYQHKEQVNFDNLTIEHIMPQTLTEGWREELGDDWAVRYDLLLHTLGNLTLTGYNSALSNSSFEEKKELLKESHLEMNKYFKHKHSWRYEDIEQRANDLADTALAIWPYFGEDKIERGIQKKGSITSPKVLSIFGEIFAVQTWRDVLEQTMNVIADMEPEAFEKIQKQFPRYIGTDKSRFRETRNLKNGMFIEVNLSSHDVQKLCLQALVTAGLTANDWEIELRDN